MHRNAKELIDKYWAAEKKASPKKSAEPSKRPRKSVGADNASDGGSASAAKKRGRKSQGKTNDKDDEERPAKKPRKSSQKKAATSSPEPMQEDEEIGNMSEHMNAPAWDHLIKNIDTVERSDNKLFVYFTLYVPPQVLALLSGLISVFLIRQERKQRAHQRGIGRVRGKVPQDGSLVFMFSPRTTN
jgi:hypothetical protein